MLTESQRRLYARHVLLPELGAAGQARLCATEVSFAHAAAPAAVEVARDYLQRAGLRVTEPHARAATTNIDVATHAELDRLAGDPALAACAQWLAGAWAAVETIKQCAGVGAPSALAAVAPLAATEESS